jgi:hypothetical protein
MPLEERKKIYRVSIEYFLKIYSLKKIFEKYLVTEYIYN